MFKAGTLVVTLGLSLVAAGCASTGAVPQPFPHPAGSSPASTPQPGAPEAASPNTPVGTSGTAAFAQGYAIAGAALALRGSP